MSDCGQVKTDMSKRKYPGLDHPPGTPKPGLRNDEKPTLPFRGPMAVFWLKAIEGDGRS